jgi:regulator of sigma E protease
MGKVVFSRRLGRDQTEWALSILPLGGYVKMLDARESDMTDVRPEDLQHEFTRQSVWRRIAIVAAGPLANFLLAIVVFAGLYMYGVPEPAPKLRAAAENSVAYQAGFRGGELITAVNGEPVRIWSDLRWQLMQAAIAKRPARIDVERTDPAAGTTAAGAARYMETRTLPVDQLTPQDLESDFLAKLGLELARPRPVLGRVLPDGAAKRAGLRAGDLIIAANGRKLVDSLQFVELVRASPGKILELDVVRDGASLVVRVTPVANEIKGRTIGKIDVEVPLAPAMVIAQERPLQALQKGAVRTWEMSILTLKMVGKMITGEMSWKNVTGPITIADYAGQTARIGAVSFLSFIAFVSISLGVMNLLPIPVLDGGLLLYYSLEVLTGRPVSERFGAIAQRAGIGILMTLMVVAIFNDIARLMS